jgi:magnesium chelatase family protein
VLFLDELPEFERRVLEVLRQPLEEGRVTITRAARSAAFPARFMFVAAMNPCPCGFLGDQRRVCRCSRPQVERYNGRISGPLRDRIDLVVDVPAAAFNRAEQRSDEPSEVIRRRVVGAREIQCQRFVTGRSRMNAAMEGVALREHCPLDAKSQALLTSATRKFCLSARGYDRVLRVSRTIADLAASSRLKMEHVAEALQYRIRSD